MKFSRLALDLKFSASYFSIQFNSDCQHNEPEEYVRQSWPHLLRSAILACPSKAELEPTLQSIKKAVNNGEFDRLLKEQ